MAGYRTEAEKTAFDRGLERFARSRVGGWLFITAFPAIDRRLMPLTGGRVRMSMRKPTLLLHCRGARTGEPRVVPLVYTPHGDDLVLVASKAGSTSHPAWYHNLRAHPDVEVEVGGRVRAVRAREAEGPERDELWAIAQDNYSGYDVYQARAGARRIPVVVLEPRPAAEG